MGDDQDSDKRRGVADCYLDLAQLAAGEANLALARAGAVRAVPAPRERERERERDETRPSRGVRCVFKTF